MEDSFGFCGRPLLAFPSCFFFYPTEILQKTGRRRGVWRERPSRPKVGVRFVLAVNGSMAEVATGHSPTALKPRVSALLSLTI